MIKTNYTWNFNDFTDPVTVLGLANARQQTHTFIQPGVYDVTLTAVNEAGASEVVQTVRVLGESVHRTMMDCDRCTGECQHTGTNSRPFIAISKCTCEVIHP